MAVDRTREAEENRFAFVIGVEDTCRFFRACPTPAGEAQVCANCVYGDFGMMFYKTADQTPTEGVCTYPNDK